MTQASLTDTQPVLLSAATQRDDLRILLPEQLRGGPAQKALLALVAKGLIEEMPESPLAPLPFAQEAPGQTATASAGTVWRALASTLNPLILLKRSSLNRRTVVAVAAVNPAALEENGHKSSAAPEELPPQAASAAAAPRPGTKLAEVMALLDRAEGATIDELTTATGWLPHTTRAALTGLRKRGIALARDKREDGATVYRLATAASAAAWAEVV